MSQWIASWACLMLCLQAFQLVDKKAFHDLLLFQQPETKAGDIPHRMKIQEVIIKKAEQSMHNLHDHFKVWSYVSGYAFVQITRYTECTWANLNHIRCMDFVGF